MLQDPVLQDEKKVRTMSDAELKNPPKKKKKKKKLLLKSHAAQYPQAPEGTIYPGERGPNAFKMKPFNSRYKFKEEHAEVIKNLVRQSGYQNMKTGDDFEKQKKLWEARGVSTKFYGGPALLTKWRSYVSDFKTETTKALAGNSAKAQILRKTSFVAHMKKPYNSTTMAQHLLRKEKGFKDPAGNKLGSTTKENKHLYKAVLLEKRDGSGKAQVEESMKKYNEAFLERSIALGTPQKQIRKPRKDAQRVRINNILDYTEKSLEGVRRLKNMEYKVALIQVGGNGKEDFSLASPGFSQDYVRQCQLADKEHLTMAYGSEAKIKSKHDLIRSIRSKLQSDGLPSRFDPSKHANDFRKDGYSKIGNGVMYWDDTVPCDQPIDKMGIDELRQFDNNYFRNIYYHPQKHHGGYDKLRRTAKQIAGIKDGWENFVSREVRQGNEDAGLRCGKLFKALDSVTAELRNLITSDHPEFSKEASEVYQILGAIDVENATYQKALSQFKKAMKKAKKKKPKTNLTFFLKK